MNKKKYIIEYANSINISKIGFTTAEPFDYVIDMYKERSKKGYQCSLEIVKNLEEKRNPRYLLKNAKTIICVLQGYELNKNVNKTPDLYGKISQTANFEDYHLIMYRKLEKLKDFLERKFGCKCKYYCDISPLSDRAIGFRSGLGFIGKNSFLINKDYGSQFFIGYIITDLEIEHYDKPVNYNLCNNCNLCVKVCPGKAILGDGQIDSTKCLSFLTQSKNIPKKYKTKIKNNLYGCDICQIVCPLNSKLQLEKFESIIDYNYPLEKLLYISNKEFKNTFKKTSSGWRGKKMLQRNAIIILGNTPTKESVNLLKEYLKDKRQDIRREVILSLQRINTNESIQIIKNHLNHEDDEEIKSIAKQILQNYNG